VTEVIKSYIMLPVTDMERAVGFYRSALDLETLTESPGWSEFVLGAGVSLALHAGMEGGMQSGLGFYVDDLEAACQATEVAGGSCIGQPANSSTSGLRLATVADTEGNSFTLVQVI